MTHARNQREDTPEEAYHTMDRIRGDILDSPMVFGLWVLGLLGVGAAAFVLSALVAQH